MDAGRNGTVRILDRDPPQITESERKGARAWQDEVVKVIAVFFEIITKLVVVLPSVTPEELGPGRWIIYESPGLFVAQAFRRGLSIATKIRVGFDRGAVCMKGIDVRRYDTALLVARILT